MQSPWFFGLNILSYFACSGRLCLNLAQNAEAGRMATRRLLEIFLKVLVKGALLAPLTAHIPPNPDGLLHKFFGVQQPSTDQPHIYISRVPFSQISISCSSKTPLDWRYLKGCPNNAGPHFHPPRLWNPPCWIWVCISNIPHLPHKSTKQSCWSTHDADPIMENIFL